MTGTPSVVHSVHYVSHGTPVRDDGTQAYVYGPDNPHPDPEIVAGVEGSEWVALTVLNPKGWLCNDACHDETTKLPGTWHWPERV
jgi:hypothetical protein